MLIRWQRAIDSHESCPYGVIDLTRLTEPERSKSILILEGLEGLLLTIVCILLWPILRYSLRNIGATKEERERDWPGDALLDRIDRSSTRAIEINAGAESIWPWIVQIGREKAGFYSYEVLENLAGLDIKNRESIVPEFQNLSEGELIQFHPNGQGLYVDTIKPDEFLLFRSWKDETEIEELRPVSKNTWCFYIVKLSERKSKLIIRSSEETLRPDFLHVISTLIIMDPIDFVMEYKMLRTIKRLVSLNAGLSD